jgi:hypothetical protein
MLPLAETTPTQDICRLKIKEDKVEKADSLFAQATPKPLPYIIKVFRAGRIDWHMLVPTSHNSQELVWKELELT